MPGVAMTNAQFAVVRKVRNFVGVVLSKYATAQAASAEFDRVAPESQYPDGGPFQIVENAGGYAVGDEIPC
jgi:hypothetical protein